MRIEYTGLSEIKGSLVALDGVPERRMEAALPAFVGGSVPARTT